MCFATNIDFFGIHAHTLASANKQANALSIRKSHLKYMYMKVVGLDGIGRLDGC